MPARQKIAWILGLFSTVFLSVVNPALSAIEFSIGSVSQSGEELEVEASLKGLTSSSCTEGKCYLQGALTSEGQNQYFGFTQNNTSSWYEYIGSPETELIKSSFFFFEPKEGTWSGKLKVKNNPSDSDYKGPGAYNLVVRRYSGKSSSHAGESNTLSVQLAYMLTTPTPAPTSTPQTTSTPSPTAVPTVTPQANGSSQTPTPSPSPSGEELIGMVAGAKIQEKSGSPSANLEWLLLEASRSASISGEIEEVAGEDKIESRSKNWWFLYSGVGLIGGSVVSLVLKRYNSGLLWLFKRRSS